MREDERELPGWVAGTLAPHLKHALGNVTRRRILRALNYSADPQTISDLLEVVPAETLAELRYHVNVLESAACVSQASEIARAGGLVRAYASNIADNMMVMDALRATERKDDWSET